MIGKYRLLFRLVLKKIHPSQVNKKDVRRENNKFSVLLIKKLENFR